MPGRLNYVSAHATHPLNYFHKFSFVLCYTETSFLRSPAALQTFPINVCSLPNSLHQSPIAALVAANEALTSRGEAIMRYRNRGLRVILPLSLALCGIFTGKAYSQTNQSTSPSVATASGTFSFPVFSNSQITLLSGLQPLTIPPFDPGLGTLVNTTFTISGHATASGTFLAPIGGIGFSTSPVTRIFNHGVQVPLSSILDLQFAVTSFVSVGKDFQPPGATLSMELTEASNVSNYPFSLGADPTPALTGQTGFVLGTFEKTLLSYSNWNATVSATVKVSYTFLPAQGLKPEITSISPTFGLQGKTITVTVDGKNFQPTSAVSFSDDGITVTGYSSRTSTQIMANIVIANDDRMGINLPTGMRDVIVTNPDSQTATDASAFTIAIRYPVIVVPGIMGTYISKGSELLWLDTSRLISGLINSDAFLMPLQLAPDGESVPGLTADRVLDGTQANSTNYYGDLLGSLEKPDLLHSPLQPNTDTGYKPEKLLFTFPYDWRSSNTANALKLRDFIEEKVVTASGRNQVDIVAHSMGGLVTRSYAAQIGESRLHKIIYEGTPHNGAPKSFGTLVFNNDNALSKFLTITGVNTLTLATLSKTFPSVFQLLPTDQFVCAAQQFIAILFVTPGCDELVSQGTAETLSLDALQALKIVVPGPVSTAHDFYKTINRTLAVPQFKIIGSGIPTVTSLMIWSDKTITPREWIGFSGNGDGTVPLKSAESAPGKNFYLNEGHSDLPKNPDSIALVLKILQDDITQLSPDDTKQLPPHVQEGKPYNVAPEETEWVSGSPIRVTIVDSNNRFNGVDSNGSIRTDTPHADFFAFEQNEGGFFPTQDTYQVNVTATGIGVFSLVFTAKDPAGSILGSIIFSQVPIGANSKGSLMLSPNNQSPVLNLDIDGDGTFDFQLSSNQPLSEATLLGMLKAIINSAPISHGIQTSLVAKVDAAAAAIIAGRPSTGQNVLNALLNEIRAQSSNNNGKDDKHITADDAKGLVVIVQTILAGLP